MVFKRFVSPNAVRMCVCCRGRYLQTELLRLKVEGATIKLFNGNGRSFYLCDVCINSNKIIGFFGRIKGIPKDKEVIKEHVEEIRNKWQKMK